MNKLSLFLLITFFCYGSKIAYPQPRSISFEKLGIKDGLPDDWVSSILQDEDGFMWFTMQNGLVKYDGYEFKVFGKNYISPEKGGLKLEHTLGGIIHGQNGKIWTAGAVDGTRNGLASYNPKTEQFRNYIFNPNDSTTIPHRVINPIFEDRQGNLWFFNSEFFASTGQSFLCRLNIQTEAIQTYPFSYYRPLYRHVLSYRERLVNQSNFDDTIWFVKHNPNGLYKWNREKDRFEIALESNSYPIKEPDTLKCFNQFPNGNLVLVFNRSIHIWSPQNEQIEQSFYHEPNNENSLSKNRIDHSFVDPYGAIWVVHLNGFSIIYPESGKVKRLEFGKGNLKFKKGSIENNLLLNVNMDSTGIWFKNRPSVSHTYYDFASGSFHFFDQSFNTDREKIIGQNPLKAFIKDHSGILWMEFRPYLYKQSPRLEGGEIFDTIQSGLPSYLFTCLMEDSKQRLWVGTDKGLCYFNPTARGFIRHPSLSLLDDIPVRKVIEDKNGQFWIGTSKGLFLWNEAQTSLTSIKLPSKKEDIIVQIIEDSKGSIWVSTVGGDLYELESQTKKIINHFSTGIFQIRCILEHSSGDIWAGGYGNFQAGLFRIDITDRKLNSYLFEKKDSVFHDNDLTMIREDSKGRIWIGRNSGGLIRYDQKSDQFIHFNTDHPLFYNSIYSFQEDKLGQLWVGTFASKGFISLNPESGIGHVVGEKKGLLQNTLENGVFNHGQIIFYKDRLWLPTARGLSILNTLDKSITNYQHFRFEANRSPWKIQYLQTKDNNIWVGTKNGLYRLFPDKYLEVNSYPPKVHISSLTINDKVYSTPDGEIFKKSVARTDEIKLPYWQKNFIFHFTALHFLDPNGNKYSWKLDNYDENWTPPSTDRKAIYTNLNPGTYTFRVKASNADGIWNEVGTAIKIVIHPPWWQTSWAYIAYLLIVLGMGYLLYQFLLNRRLEKEEAIRLRELDDVKNRLYTNITHEFRTPLTIIMGMADKIKDNPKNWFSEGILMIKRNSHQLLNLINQLLDLRKLQSGRLTLQPIQSNIISYLKYHLEAFHSYAQARDIRLHFICEEEEILMDFSPKEVQHIMNNLISNAIKYNKEEGDVYLKVNCNKDQLRIRVEDTGIGIPEEQIPFIFDRFYQADSEEHRKIGKAGVGTGVGLALSKELVKIMKGEISVSSKIGIGTVFEILLPIEQSKELVSTSELGVKAHYSKLSSSPVVLVEKINNLASSPQILIVEDNPDVMFYLESCLHGNYQLNTAKNGEEGITKALEQIPDLIISDVMMPIKNGYELCATLKQDMRTSHIPIILLTAKGDLDSKLEGLEQGADAYLAKPFEEKELLTRIDQMIKLRKKLQEKYGGPLSQLGKPGNNTEKQFLQRIQETILANVEDENFGITQLCKALHLSRTQVHRKLKTLTGKSTSHVIREIRLQKAKELLQTTDLNISQVAYEVGFSKPGYFTEVFVETFGQTPSEYKAMI